MATFLTEMPAIRGRRRRESDLPYLMINPPLTDPTQPYHSIPYLVAAARRAGFSGGRCVDANIDALNHLARPENVGRLLERAAATRRRIEASTDLTRADELDYRAALGAEGLSPEFVGRAIDIFRDGRSFYHHPTYRQAVLAMNRWQELLCLDGVPESIADFQIRPGPVVNLSCYADLCDPALIDRLTGPFDPYVRGPFLDVIGERQWRVVGLSVAYTGQLPMALRLAREIRAARPETVIVFGGTEVCDHVRFARVPGDYWRIFTDADLIVPGEGETPFCDILAAVRDGRDLAGIPGVLTREDTAPSPSINYENVADLPTPAYDVWDWNAYWSPEPVILYSPTRGCYWNKCTFCDYGLNSDRPTSPSRERPVEAVIKDLEEITGVGRTVYFAVDAMSPRYLRLLCDAMKDLRDPVRWSAELRLERTFPKRDMAKRLKDAGCVAISFGYESGSQRVLDLIDKGVRLTDVPDILRDLARYDIGAQMMGFTGFPGERDDEAARTYDFLLEHDDLWSLAGIGTFSLTPGSMVAKNPGAFAVEILPLPPSEDIARYLPWRDTTQGANRWPGEIDRRVDDERMSLVRRTSDDRPYVGGIDTAHTLLYFAAFGRRLWPDPPLDDPGVDLVPISDPTIPFANIEEFAGFEDVRDQFFLLKRNGGASSTSIAPWLGGRGSARRGDSSVAVLPSGRAFTIPVAGQVLNRDRLRALIKLTAQLHGDF
ncbi:B12-binding domain-containing radical SAM protein [Actinoallomurus soli]|uniref:B12-binding domain-containing radical SAM protein n=1 Tax=Actinoallomurus soli TaxID=2952535 RepID=UPI0020936F1A|nr:radical SAM protein [Actinoallomurus soli]MCO5973216.1 B12-binding domain-containing radical SAM protein [Actinoallomurus soli]